MRNPVLSRLRVGVFILLAHHLCAFSCQQSSFETLTWIKQQSTNHKKFTINDVIHQQAQQNQILFDKSANNKNSGLFIFVSFSMPETSLKQWLAQANQVNGVLVIRGLVNNSFKETTLKLASLIKEQHGGMQLNPPLFKTYHITQVPAVVLTNGKNTDVIYGDVPLRDSLQKMAELGDNHVLAKQLIEQLEKSDAV